MEKLDRFRQPMVTATGIFLGFLLDFTSTWTQNAFSKHKFRDIVLAICISVSLAALLLVLIRMLKIRYPIEDLEKYYRRTLNLVRYRNVNTVPGICYYRDRQIC